MRPVDEELLAAKVGRGQRRPGLCGVRQRHLRLVGHSGWPVGAHAGRLQQAGGDAAALEVGVDPHAGDAGQAAAVKGDQRGGEDPKGERIY